jgi:hypothetical protein
MVRCFWRTGGRLLARPVGSNLSYALISGIAGFFVDVNEVTDGNNLLRYLCLHYQLAPGVSRLGKIFS